ncbi:glycosyl hydrolase 108 family protein [Sphingomonas sp.]|uniref:glycoside hydrolase family 108 protein n=1 Tax=Sphingomonas sp. TaxID=28214 RepID=UPI0031D4714B
MATLSPFEESAAHTLGIEGGFSDHPSDRGGKTQWGITEAVARADGYTGPMAGLPKARALAIYRRLYWDRIGLDWIAAVDRDTAAELFDTAVNMGVSVAVTFLQRVLNALNRQGRDYPDLKVDGSAGPATATALRALIARRGIVGRNAVLTYLNALQGARYVELAEARAANEDFVLGWAQRVAFTFPLTIRKAA